MKCFVNDLLNKSLLIYEDFCFMYQYNPVGRPSDHFCFYVNIKTRVRKLPASFEHANTLTFSVSSPGGKTWKFLETFSIFTESGLLRTCMPHSSVLTIFPGVTEGLFSVTTISLILKHFATGSFFDILLKTDLHIASNQSAFSPSPPLPPPKRETRSMVHFHFHKLNYLKLPIL